jgi:hypothetical protein
MRMGAFSFWWLYHASTTNYITMVGSEVPPPGDYNNKFDPRQNLKEERMRGIEDARNGGCGL